MPEIKLSDNAVKRIKTLLEKEEKGAKLRVCVNGGGCSGFRYDFSFTNTQNNDDIIIKKDNVTLLIDSVSIDFLKDSTLDYVETLGAAHFEFKNPQASSTCGCGNSFSV